MRQKEKDELMELLYKYKDAFSLRDEIGTCPNKEIEIDMVDIFTFLLRSCHVKQEHKKILDKEMKMLVHLGFLKEGFSAYSSPVMLISGKLTQDKTCASNVGILILELPK